MSQNENEAVEPAIKLLVEELVKQVSARNADELAGLAASVQNLANLVMAIVRQREIPPHAALAMNAMGHLIMTGKAIQAPVLAKRAYDIADAMMEEATMRAEIRRRVKEKLEAVEATDGSIEDKVAAAVAARESPPVPAGEV